MSGNGKLKLEVILAAIDRVTAPLKTIMAGSKGVAKEVKTLRDQLKDLNATQSKIDGFAKLREQSRQATEQLHKHTNEIKAHNVRLEHSKDTQAKVAGQVKVARKSYEGLENAMQNLQAPSTQMLRQLAMRKAALERLETQYTQAQNAHRRNKEALRNEESALKSNKEQRQRLATSLAIHRQKLRESGIATHQLAQSESQLKSKVESANAALKTQQSRLEQLNHRQERLIRSQKQYDKSMGTRNKFAGAGVAMGAAGAATTATALIPVSEYAKAENSAMQLKVAMMTAGGAVSKQFNDVNALAEKLGNALPGTTSDFQDMMKVLIQKGLPATAVLNGAGEATANLAVLTKVSFAESAEAIGVFQDSMGVADKDMVAAADQMQRLYNVGMKIGDIQQGFKALGPALSYVRKGGIDAVNALGPLLAITDAAGMDAASAGNAYNKIIRGSVDKDKVDSANDDLKATGVKLNFVDKKGNFAGIDNMVNQIMKLQNLSDQTRRSVIQTVFGSDKEVSETLNALSKAGNSGIAAMRKKLADQASLQERIKAQLGTLTNLWDAASGTFTNALVKFGEAIAPEVKATVEWINTLSERLGSWAKENPKLANTIMKLTAIIGLGLIALGGLSIALATILGPLAIMRYGLTLLGLKGEQSISVLSRLAKLLPFLSKAAPAAGQALPAAVPVASAAPGILASAGRSVLPLLSSGLASVTAMLAPLSGMFVSLGAVIMATPIGWLIGGIAALIAVGLLVYKYWAPIKAFFTGFFGALISTAMPAIQALWQACTHYWGSLATLLSGIPILGPLFKMVGTIAMGVLGAIAWGVQGLWGWIKNLLQPVNDTGNAAKNMGAAFGAALGNIVSMLVSLPTKFITVGAQMIDGLISGITSRIDSLKATLGGVADGATGWVKQKLGIHSPSRIFAELGGFTMQGFDQGLNKGQNAPLATLGQMASSLVATAKNISLPLPAMPGLPKMPDLLSGVSHFSGKLLASGSLALGASLPVLANVPMDNRPAISATAKPAAAPVALAPITIQIYQQPGQDPKLLAQLVAAEIEKIQRTASAKGRSRLSDKD